LQELAGTSGGNPTPVVLTLDRDLQLITVEALTDAFNYAAPNWGAPGIATGGSAVVLDVNSGAILAMASFPLFNPSLYSPETMTPNRGNVLAERVINNPRSPLSNRAIQERFSPGSVFKVITLAAILNEGMVDLDEIFYCDLIWEGQEYGDTLPSRPDWRATDEMEPSGNVTPAMALMASCNPFFWQYGAILFSEVGESTVNDYARRMGLGQTYDFGGAWPEAEGQLPTPIGADVALINAVGQGDIALPPIQMAVATMSIANGGPVYEPYLVKQIGGMDGTEVVETFEPTILNTLDFNPGVIEAIQEGMCGVITNEKLGTAWGRFHNWGPLGYAVTNANYTLCGKTGTAQTGRYPNAWFLAYAPAENPQIAIVVMVEQSKEGSQIATPIVRRILDDYFGQPREPYPIWWGTEEFLPLDIPEGGGTG
jgi:penicillin-binding protein 2